MEKTPVLIVDDEPNIRHMLAAALRPKGYDPKAAGTAAEALAVMADNRFGVILCDVRLPDRSGLELLAELRELDPRAVIIMISAYGGMDTAMEAVRRGANDFLAKPFTPEEVLLRMRKAEEGERLREENARLQAEVREKYSFHRIIGKSQAMRSLFDQIARVAPSKATVLITGESGTGKELVARALHYASPRRDRPFVPVNCGAIPENLLESELFGHVKGAFTGAVGHKRGLFEEADGGTIFLDEIGEMPQALQVKLLRVLQEDEVRKVGDTRTVKVDVRVIAATARNLVEEVRAGRFREELFYRLNVVALALPPLRRRTEDIPLLADQYLRTFGARSGRTLSVISPRALQLMMAYPWPGNVRELVNVIERAVLLSEGETIGPGDLPENLRAAISSPAPAEEEGSGGYLLRDLVAEAEKRGVARALAAAGGNRSKAAVLLGISIRSLLYKIKEHALDRRPD
jgi:two-component system response regulator AtoC